MYEQYVYVYLIIIFNVRAQTRINCSRSVFLYSKKN